MARYTKTISIQKDHNAVMSSIIEYLQQQGFKQVMHRGEQVWKKGMGIMLGPQYVKVDAADNEVRLQAWIMFALLPGIYVGEMGITGMIAAIPKSNLRKRVEQIESFCR